MHIKREAECLFKQFLATNKVGIVVGARQVGKTTLVQHMLTERSTLFLNFDIEVDKARFVTASALSPTDAMTYLGNPSILVIDEAQRLPVASRIIKGWYDAGVAVKFILLGSSALDLLDQSAESLTGRNWKLNLPPLLFAEAITTQEWARPPVTPELITQHCGPQLRAFLMMRMVFGSYPEVVTASEPMPLLRQLSSDYLWKDVLQAGLIKTPNLIKRLLMLLAHQAGSEVFISELATQLQMSRATVDRYIDLLEETFVIFRLPAFSRNPRKEISKSQKIFFWDTGIRNALINSFSLDAMRPDIGMLWENWVIAEVAKRNVLYGSPANLHFWRTRSRSEVDLVLQQGEKLQAYEIKWSSRRVNGRAFREAYGAEVELICPENPFINMPVS